MIKIRTSWDLLCEAHSHSKIQDRLKILVLWNSEVVTWTFFKMQQVCLLAGGRDAPLAFQAQPSSCSPSLVPCTFWDWALALCFCALSPSEQFSSISGLSVSYLNRSLPFHIYNSIVSLLFLVLLTSNNTVILLQRPVSLLGTKLLWRMLYKTDFHHRGICTMAKRKGSCLIIIFI